MTSVPPGRSAAPMRVTRSRGRLTNAKTQRTHAPCAPRAPSAPAAGSGSDSRSICRGAIWSRFRQYTPLEHAKRARRSWEEKSHRVDDDVCGDVREQVAPPGEERDRDPDLHHERQHRPDTPMRVMEKGKNCHSDQTRH